MLIYGSGVNMSTKRLMLLFLSPLTTYLLIFLAIFLAPWFRWSKNALSNLGNVNRSSVTPIFNLGLATGGLLLILYSVIYLREDARYAWIGYLLAGHFQQLIGVFNEVYGVLHVLIAILFYIFLGIAQAIHSIERRSKAGIPLLFIYFIIWAAYYNNFVETGLAVPEIISSLIMIIYFIAEEIKQMSKNISKE